MEKTKKIISILLVFLLSIGVCCNFEVFAQEIDVSMSEDEYNKNIIEEFGLKENTSTEKNGQELDDILETMIMTNTRKSGWFSVNGKSDLISLFSYSTYSDKTYNVSYSKENGYIRSFTIVGLDLEYPGDMPTDTTFGVPFFSREDWNNIVKEYIPQSPSEISGKDLSEVMWDSLLSVNYVLTENHETWGLTINGITKQKDIESFARSIKNDAKYKVEYTMDNGYIRNFAIEEITASTPTPVPSETEQEENLSNSTESQTDSQNQESNKQHILDDEPNTGLVF